MKVLVAYASKYGSIRGIAERIAELKWAVSPLGHRVFAGAWDRAKLDRGKLGLAERMIARVLPQGDFRDWAAIEEWGAQHRQGAAGTADSIDLTAP